MSRSGLFALLVLAVLAIPIVPVRGSSPDISTSDPGSVTSPALPAGQSTGSSDQESGGAANTGVDKGFVDVVVFTSDAGELGRALEVIPHQGLIGTATGGGFSTPRLTIPSWAVDMVKALPSTIGVYDYPKLEKHVVDNVDTLSDPMAIPTNVDAVNNQQAPAAWARGYRGEGTKIAVVDDGVDFAHPDLMGTMARYNVSEISNKTLETKPWLTTYDGWPISFDATSMDAFLRTGGKAEGAWYANTTSTDDTVWHTIKVDGKNDFWTDGSEKVAIDSNSDIVEFNGSEARQDYNLVDLWVTQDLNNWFFGFTSKTNHSSLDFGLYINTTSAPPWNAGATYDPLGNYITTVSNQSPEFAVYMTHLGGQPAGRYDRNDTIENATVWKWEGTTWGSPVNVTDQPIGGQFSYGRFDFKKGEGWVEFSIPKKYMGNPPAISVELFTTGTNRSHAQDSSYSDLNVNFARPDWSSSNTQLSAFAEVHRSYWHHTNRLMPGDRETFSWPIHYLTTSTSKSGKYYFGDHPDKNLPQTRILVVDEAQAGVYDTVYVDLDHNKMFGNDKPIKKYGKYDSNMVWHPADWNGQGKIYDETSYMDFYDPGGAVRSLAYSPDGRWMASGGEDHQVILWNTAGWSIRWAVNPEDGRPVSLAFSPDSSKLAAGFDDASGGRYYILIWNIPSGTPFTMLQGHTGSVNALAWSQDGSKIASASSDGTARIWIVAGGPTTYLNHPAPVTGLSWNWATSAIATSSTDGDVRLWNAGTGALQRTLVYGQPLTSIDSNPAGSILATSSTDGAVIIWDVASGSFNVPDLYAHFLNPVLSVRFNASGTGLVSSSAVSVSFGSAPTVVRWYVPAWDGAFVNRSASSACQEGTKYYRSPVAVFAANGTQIASGCGNSPIKLWDIDLNLQGTLRGHLVGVMDYKRWDTGDGLPDISGGTMYFIAQNYYYPSVKRWGTPIPYSDAFQRRNGIETLSIPANGTLVAFTGALDLNMKHGTLMASSMVGRGVSRYYDATTTIPYPMTEPTAPQVFGISPAAKIVSVGDIYTGSVFDAWWFTAQGYDGEPNSGDEPQIAANAFGTSSVLEDGWDFYSRFVDWISIVYAKGSITFVMSAGNDGPGYGTMNAPASGAGVITAGASTDFYYRKTSGLEGSKSPSYGDVVPFSGRGPTALGTADPDVLANGRMSYGSTPLNLVQPYNGLIASELWSGTSLSAPLTAGILALTEQAYRQTHGQWPIATTAKSILMSSCDDINYDVYSQGAGFLNADRATKLAANLEGFLVTPSLWTPGNYTGRKYEAFTAMLDAGASDTQKFTVKNIHPTSTEVANLSTEIFHKFAQIDFAFNALGDATGNATDNWITLAAISPAISATSNLRTPGMYLLIPPNTMRLVAPLQVGDWIKTDLLRITFSANFSSLDGDHDGVLGGSKDFTYNLDLYDWTWDDTQPAIPHTSNFADLNRMTINHPTANVVSATVHNPAIRTHDGLTVGIRRFPTGAKGIYLKVTMELYNSTSWNSTLTLDTNTLTIPANSSATFNATLTVPPGTPVGNYEGAMHVTGNPQASLKHFEVVAGRAKYLALDHFNIRNATVWNGDSMSAPKLREGIDYTIMKWTGLLNFTVPLNAGRLITVYYQYYQTVTIPISVTVPAHGVIFNWSSGRVLGQEELYGNVISSGFGNGGKSGDWRFYPTILPEGGLFDLYKGTRFLARVTWELSGTDIDVFSFSQGGGVIVSAGADLTTGRYGPFLVGKNNGGSTVTSLTFTTTGKNAEISSPGLAGGLNIIAIHVVHMNGSAYEEDERGEIGIFGLSPRELNIVTNKLYGQSTFQMYSSMPWTGIGAVSAGPSPPARYMNEHVKQDATEGDFVTNLAKGSYTRLVRVVPSALIFSVNISSDTGFTDRPCPDLDLGIFLDGKGGTKPDGIAQPEELIAYSAGPSATEQVRLIRPSADNNPADPGVDYNVVGAPYLIKVLGFSVPWAPYGTFNMDVTLVQGVGFNVQGMSTLNIVPYNLSRVNLTWNLQGSTKQGKLLGALYLGPSDAPLMYLVPVTMVIDFNPPVITKFSLSPADGKRVDAATGRTTNDPVPSFVVEVSDSERGELDPDGVKAYLDGADVSTWVTTSFPYTANPTSLVQGRWSGSIRFEPTAGLADGPHSFKVSIPDVAGNRAEQDYTVIVDTQAPMLAVEGPRTAYTNRSEIAVRGTTEPGATVTAMGMSTVAGPDGAFSFRIRLSPGVNMYTVKATDWFGLGTGGVLLNGNSASLDLTAIYDTNPPTIQASVSPSLLTNLDSVMLFGFVNDTAPGKILSPTTLLVTVNGEPVIVDADGSFTSWLRLQKEGANNITISAVDLAGNSASQSITVVRDTAPPLLQLDSSSGVVTGADFTVRGRTTPGSSVKVNGFDAVVAPDGTFERPLSLSKGMNAIVVRATDSAENSVERRIGVFYSSSFSPEAGGATGYLGLSPAAWAVILIVIGVVIGIILQLLLGGRQRGGKETAEKGGTEVEETQEEGELTEETLPPEAHPPEEEEVKPEEDEKTLRLRRAFEEGKINKEVYEENLRRLKKGS